MHKVAILVLDDVVPLDFGIACQVFAIAKDQSGSRAYAVQICGLHRTVKAPGFEVRVNAGLELLDTADTIVVPGVNDPLIQFPRRVTGALQKAWDRGARVTSICTGAFVLAASGLLDGKRATTHWMFAPDLADRHPNVTVEPNVLYVDEGRIMTSAGASAGLDMCLYVVGRDLGQAAAARTACLAVAPLSRDGGQAQFIRHDLPTSPASLAALVRWMGDNLNQPQSVEDLAARAGMSPRTFARRFREQTGTTPLQWLVSARVKRAQCLLEECDEPIDQTAMLAGFDSPVTFRARFRRAVGLTPTEYRRRFSVNNSA